MGVSTRARCFWRFPSWQRFTRDPYPIILKETAQPLLGLSLPCSQESDSRSHTIGWEG